MGEESKRRLARIRQPARDVLTLVGLGRLVSDVWPWIGSVAMVVWSCFAHEPAVTVAVYGLIALVGLVWLRNGLYQYNLQHRVGNEHTDEKRLHESNHDRGSDPIAEGKQDVTTATSNSAGELPFAGNSLFRILEGRWFKTYIWKGRPGSETATINEGGFYHINDSSSPRFYLADPRYDQTRHQLQFVMVSLRNRMPCGTWDAESLRLSDDECQMIGVSRNSGNRITSLD